MVMSARGGYRGLASPEAAWRSYSAWVATVVERRRARGRTTADDDRVRSQQEILLAASQSCAALSSALRQRLRCAPTATLRFPTPHEPVTTEQLQRPREAWETSLHRALRTADEPVTRADAAQNLFWVVSHVSWLEAEMLPEPPLRAFVYSGVGAGLLKAAPTEMSDEQRLDVDSATRDLLRHLGGIPHVHDATVSHLREDCPSSRAWWRTEAAQQAQRASAGGLTFGDCYEVFSVAGLWVAYVRASMTRTAVLAAPTCGAGFVEACLRHRVESGALPSKATAVLMLQNMARRCAGLHPGAIEHRRLAELAAP